MSWPEETKLHGTHEEPALEVVDVPERDEKIVVLRFEDGSRLRFRLAGCFARKFRDKLAKPGGGAVGP